MNDSAPKPPKDAAAEIKKILNDVAGGHDLDRGEAKKLVAAIKAGTVTISGTY